MYSSSAPTPRRVKPLPKRRRTGSISTNGIGNLNHYYYPTTTTNGSTPNGYPLPLPLPLNLPPLPHNLPNSPLNLPNLPFNLPLNFSPTPGSASDDLLAQWREYCLPILGHAADALLSAGGLGGQVYSGARSVSTSGEGAGDGTDTEGGTGREIEGGEDNGGGSGGGTPSGDSNVPNTTPVFPFPGLTPQIASQLTAQLETFISLATATAAVTSQPESTTTTTNGTRTSTTSAATPATAAAGGASTQGQAHTQTQTSSPQPQPQLDPVTAAAYFTHHLNAHLRAAGLSGIGVGVGVGFAGTPPSSSPHSHTVQASKPHPQPQGRVVPTQLSQGHDGVRIGGGAEVSRGDYREEDPDDRDDDRANGRNNTKKRKVPGVGSSVSVPVSIPFGSGMIMRSGSGSVVGGVPVNTERGVGLDRGGYGYLYGVSSEGDDYVLKEASQPVVRGGGGDSDIDAEGGNRVKEVVYSGDFGRGPVSPDAAYPSSPYSSQYPHMKAKMKSTISRVTMAGIQHKTRKKQLASVLFRETLGGVGNESAMPVATTTGSTSPSKQQKQNGGKQLNGTATTTSVSVSRELALDQMLSDLTGLGLYAYPSLALPPIGTGTGTTSSLLTDQRKVKVRLSKRERVRNARSVPGFRASNEQGSALGGGKSGGKANKENDYPPPRGGTGKKKKGKGGATGAATATSREAGGVKDTGTSANGERGILAPKCKFTFTWESATSDRLQATKEEVRLLRGKFEAELARQSAKIAAGEGGTKNSGAGDGHGHLRGGKNRRVVSSNSNNGGGSGVATSPTAAKAENGIDTTTTVNSTSNVDNNVSLSPLPPPATAAGKNVNKKKKKKRSALANASNPHHLRNYVPSRVPGVPNSQGNHGGNHSNNRDMGANDPDLLGPLPLRFLGAEIRDGGKRKGGSGKRDVTGNSNSGVGANSGGAHASTTGLNNVNLTNPSEEWICAFCEYELFYGDDSDFRKAVRKRKAILKRRKRAREKAADKASGEASRRVKERQRELEREQMQQGQLQGTSGQSQANLHEDESDPYEDEGEGEEEEEEEEEEGYVENPPPSAVRAGRG